MDFFKAPMNTASIRNGDLIELLNKFSDLVQEIDVNEISTLRDMTEVGDDWYTSQEYCKKIMYKGREHFGFPEASHGYELRAHFFRHDDKVKQVEYCNRGEKIVDDIVMYLGAHRKALSMVYPSGGYIGWHNNANAPGYNIIFTWSSEGDGHWEHIDPKTKEHVVIPDVKGWQCKYGYYGTYDEPDKLLYHAAKTNCLRATVAFVFNSDETAKRMAEHVVEEIETA